jgi:hypothetical protein
MLKKTMPGLLALLLTSCVSPAYVAPPQVAITAPIDDAAIAKYSANGTATITGQAFTKTRGGDVKPCAGDKVLLVPSMAYTDQAVAIMVSGRGIQGGAMEGRVRDLTRSVIGDAQGNFSFEKLPAGTYHVLCNITWEVPSGTRYGGLQTTGGWAWGHATVRDGETVKVIAN